ncbi:MAG: hypothetical protein Q8Q12_13075 [bacterium]|nr:hypothetical protein [bacterium]
MIRLMAKREWKRILVTQVGVLAAAYGVVVGLASACPVPPHAAVSVGWWPQWYDEVYVPVGQHVELTAGANPEHFSYDPDDIPAGVDPWPCAGMTYFRYQYRKDGTGNWFSIWEGYPDAMPKHTFYEAGSYEIKLTVFDNDGQSATDICMVYMVQVVIDTPVQSSYPALVCKGEKLQLGCTVTPPEAGGGTYQWSKVSGPGTVTFTPSATAEDPQFSANQPGKYAVKVEYTIWGDTYSDTTQLGTQGPNGDIVVWRVFFQEDASSHWSIEGRRDGGGYKDGLLGEWGDEDHDDDPHDYWVNLYSMMWTDATGFQAKYGSDWWLEPSGEQRWRVCLDVGDASVDVNVVAHWSSVIIVTPVSTDITSGANVICSIGWGSYGEFRVSIVNGERREIPSELHNPDSDWFTAEGTQIIGYIEAGVEYQDHGADHGKAEAYLYVEFSVGVD